VLDVNDVPASGPRTLSTTHDVLDPIARRQWHCWNLASNLAKRHLLAGKNVRTVHFVTEGQMNLAA
jgi:hypothetical protein